jgi:hypothetical protein
MYWELVAGIVTEEGDPRGILIDREVGDGR